MSAVDNFETLSNAELHKQLLKYNLVNVPVTDSSRNVIIKKLRAAATSAGVAATAAKKQNRRETIAVVERAPASPALEISKTADTSSATPSRSRRTIAAAASKDESLPEMPARRRSVNAATLNETPSSKDKRRSVRDSPVPKSRASALIVLDSDDEDDVVAALDKVEQQQQQQVANTRRSTSRGPSLSKTTVVTNVYSQSLAPLVEEVKQTGENALAQQQMRENIEAINAARHDYVQQMQQQKRQREKEQQLQQQAEQQRLQQQLHQQAEQQKLQRAQQQQLLQQAEQQKLQRAQQQFMQQQHAERLYKEPAAVAITAPRYAGTEYQHAPLESTTISTASTLSALSSNASRFSAQPVYPRATNLYPRLDTRGSLASSGFVSRSNVYNDYSDDTDAELLNADEDAQKSETPFLSNFARNLNRLKAEPLGGSDLTLRYRRSSGRDVTGRASVHRLGHSQNGRMQRLSYYNRKYNLTRHFFLLIVLIIVVYTSYKFWQ